MCVGTAMTAYRTFRVFDKVVHKNLVTRDLSIVPVMQLRDWWWLTMPRRPDGNPWCKTECPVLMQIAIFLARRQGLSAYWKADRSCFSVGQDYQPAIAVLEKRIKRSEMPYWIDLECSFPQWAINLEVAITKGLRSVITSLNGKY